MANFETSLAAVLHHEGGYVDDPDDSGGATNMGITHATLAAWRKREVNRGEVKDLTEAEAGEIYKANYWDKLLLDEVQSQALAEAVMDMGVNAGVGTAARLLQMAVNWLVKSELLQTDGWIGPVTVRAVNGSTERLLLQKFFELRVKHYMAICRNNKSQRKFLYAWIKRSLDHSGS